MRTLCFGSLSFSSFFPRLMSVVADWMSTILLDMVWLWCEFRMQVSNVLHAARWKCRTQKIAIWASLHNFVWLYLRATKARIDNLKKNLLKQQCLPHMSSHYDELQPTSGWDLLASLGHPSKFQLVSHLGSITAWHSSSGHQPKFAALNRGRHLHLTGWPSSWALAHTLVLYCSL